MQKNLVQERTEKQYIIRSVTTGEENTGIDAGFIRTVHRNLMRLYQLYVFVFARGKRAMQEAEQADFVVKIESGSKRQSEQYALFYVLPPALYAKTAHDAMAKGGTASAFEDYRVEPVSVCAVEDMTALTEKLSGIRCRTQKDFIASMRVLCRAVVTVETPFAMTIDVKNTSDMDSVLDFTDQYMYKEETVSAPDPYAMFESDLPAPVSVTGGIAKRGPAVSPAPASAGITPLMGNIPKAAPSRPAGMFAASVPFEGERVHANAFGKIVSAPQENEEVIPSEEFDVTTAFDAHAALDLPRDPMAEPASKPNKKKQRTSPFWIGHEEELDTPAQAQKQNDAVIYEADSLPFVAQTVTQAPVVQEPIVQEVPAPQVQESEKVSRETLILPGNVIDIFEEKEDVEESKDAPAQSQGGIMAYRFDYFADHSTASKRDRQLKSPFEASAPTIKTETTVPDAHIDDLLVRPAAKAPAVQEEVLPDAPMEDLTIAFDMEEADEKRMHYVPVDGVEIAVLTDANADEAAVLEQAKQIAAQIAAQDAAEEAEETAKTAEIEEEAVAEDESVLVETEETSAEAEEEVAEAVAQEEPVFIEMEETPAEAEEENAEAVAREEPVLIEMEETSAETVEEVVEPVVEEEPVFVEMKQAPAEQSEETAEEGAEVVEEAEEPEEELTAEQIEEAAADEPAPIQVPLFYTREAHRAELDEELDEMFGELRRPAPAPKMSQLDAIMLELELVDDTRATAVRPAQELLWQQEEMARAAARQAEEEFAQILVQHSVEAAQQVMQEEMPARDAWIDIDMTEEEAEESQLLTEEVLQTEDSIFSAEENFSQEYMQASQTQEEAEESHPIAADESVWEAVLADTQEIAQAELAAEVDVAADADLEVELEAEAADAADAPYAYDVEVLVADEVSPQEADRIVEDYRRSVGAQEEDPWQQVRQQWNIPEPQAMVDGEPVSPQKAAFIREEADAIADELASIQIDEEEELRLDMEAPDSDDAFAARSLALYDKLRVMEADYPQTTVRQDITIELDEPMEEGVEATETEDASDYEIIVLEDEPEEAVADEDIEIELYEMDETSDETQEACDDAIIVSEDDIEEEAADDIEIELYEMDETSDETQEACDDEIIVSEDEIEEAADDIEIELYEMEETSDETEEACDYEIIVSEDEIEEEAADDIEIELYEMDETSDETEDASDYEIIVLDDEQPAAQDETETAADEQAALQEEPSAQAEDRESAKEEAEADVVLDPETALRQRIMREMPESLRNSPMAAQAAALLATMYRVDADAARLNRQMAALNPQDDEEQTRAIYGRTSVEEELPADFDLFDEQRKDDAPDVIHLGGVSEAEVAEAETETDVEVEAETELEIESEEAAKNPDVIELGPASQENVVVVEGELFIPADEAEALNLPQDQIAESYGYQQVEVVEEEAVETVSQPLEESFEEALEESSRESHQESIEDTQTIARDIFEQYNAMDEMAEEQPQEAEVASQEEFLQDEAQRVAYDPMDDAQNYFVPSAVEMELEEEGYPGEIYDEHLLSYAAQAQEIEQFDRRMQEEYRQQAAAEALEETAQDAFEEDLEEDFEEAFEEDFDDADDYSYDDAAYADDTDDTPVEDVYIEGVDDLMDDLPLVREDTQEDLEAEFDEEFDEEIDEEFDADFEEEDAAQDDSEEDFYDAVIDELDDAQFDDFAIEEARLAREQERLEAEIAEQERLIAESRASRAQLDELAAELDRSIARENLAAQRAAREQVERERFERTQQMPAVEDTQDYQYAQVGEPMGHRMQGKKVARHRNKRWFR